jgi:hypothetical protein
MAQVSASYSLTWDRAGAISARELPGYTMKT